MVFKESKNDSATRTAAQFATTHWSLVLAAGQTEAPQVGEALEKLCRTYWYPLYAYFRREGYHSHVLEKVEPDAFEKWRGRGALPAGANADDYLRLIRDGDRG